MKIIDANIKEFISKVDVNRKSIRIQGQHKYLNSWIEWYKGTTKWHNQTRTTSRGDINVTIMSTGIAKLIGEEWASNYANEDTKLTVKNESQNDLVQEILKKNRFFAKFNSFAEMFNCLGIGATLVMPSNFELYEDGTILKGDTDVKVSFIQAERVIPITLYDGECTECAFVTYGTSVANLQMHLLIDGKYQIAEVEARVTDGGEYTFDWENMKIIQTDTDVPLFQIWHPNIKDNSDLENPLGASVYCNCEDTFKCLDMAFDSFFKEFKNGAKKRFISADLVKVGKDAKLKETIVDEEEYVLPQGEDGHNWIQEFNGELRVQAFIQAINFWMNYAAKQCGLGDNKFSFEGNGSRPIQTATGVIAKETELYRNVIKQENFATDKFRKMLLAIKYVNNTFTNNSDLTFEEEDIEITYDDNIVEDTDSKKKQDLQEVVAGIRTPYEYRALYFDEDEETAKKNLQESGILADKYLATLQAGAMTPKQFVDLVYGEKCEDHEEIVDYITEKMATPQDISYEDESDLNEDDEEDNPSREEAKNEVN